MTTTKNKTKFGSELYYDTSFGNNSFQPFSGTLENNPSIIIFNNQSNVTALVSDIDNEEFVGLTLAAGQGLSLDLRTNKSAPSDDFSWPIGTQFYCLSDSGTGYVTISYVYAE